MTATNTPAITSLNGGELSPMMGGRSDTAIYQIGVELMENFVPAIEGPIQKCPGFMRIRPAAATASWLFPFVFNVSQGYVVEASDEVFRFYTNGGRIETDAVTPYELAVPYAAADMPALSMQQSFDKLYLAHGSYQQRVLRRLTATTFDCPVDDTMNGPFNDGNSDDTVTVTVAGALTVGGTATITASSAIFTPPAGGSQGHVGGLFRVEAHDLHDVPAWQVGMDGVVAGTSTCRSDFKVYVAATSGRTGTEAPVHEEGTEWDGGPGTDINGKGPYGVQWAYVHDRFGILRITAVDPSGLSATATVVRRVPDSLSTAGSFRWSHGCFSDAEGWPDHVFIWASRKWYIKGFDLIGSVVGDYPNFQQYTSGGYLAADLAIRLTMSLPDRPLWVKVDRVPILGTSTEEYAINLINAAAGVQAGNIDMARQSRYGSADVQPVEAGASIIYVQRGGKQLREADYNFGTDKYVSANINRWARHIAGDAMVQLGQQQIPEELLFAVRSDGQLVFRSYDPEQEVKGFARRTIGGGGKVISAVSIPSTDVLNDDIWALIDWNGARSVQLMAPWWKIGTDKADAFFVDDGLSDSLDVASATISGLDHLVGVTVSILADGGVELPQIVPTGGTITISAPAKKRVVGRGYSARLRSLPPDLKDGTGQSSQAKKQKLVTMALRVLDMMGVRIRAKTAADPNGKGELALPRQNAALIDAAPLLFSGDTPAIPVGGDWGERGQYELVSDDPVPCFVVAQYPRYEVGDR